jgi:hypothetical protein
MSAAGVVTLVGVGITVVALALYLITIAGILNHVTRRLDRILEIIRGIAMKTQPLSGVVSEIASDIGQAERGVRDLAARAAGPQRRPPARARR